MEKKGGEFKLIFPDVERFYKECDEVEETGNKNDDKFCKWEDINNKVDEKWVGLSKEKIIKSKYMYTEGLNKLKEIEKDINLGGTRRSYKWDEVDGDDMNYDRFIENLAYLKRRIYKLGKGSGRIVNIHVSIGENWTVTYEKMMLRSYTIMRVIDYLENLGYRVGVTVYMYVKNLGYYKDEKINTLYTEITIKKPEDPLIKGFILTCISPWMLRYHIFKLWTAKFKCNYGLGCAVVSTYEDTSTDIYFDTGSCLDEESCQSKIEELSKIFGFNE